MRWSWGIMLLLILAPTSHLMGQTRAWHQYSVKQGLPSSTVYSVRQDIRGIIWMATNKGLVRFDGEEFSVYSSREGLNNVEVFGLSKGPDDRIWLLSFSDSLFYIQNDSIKGLPTHESSDQFRLHNFIPDRHSLFYFLTNEPKAQYELRIDQPEKGRSEVLERPNPPYFAGIDNQGQRLWVTPGDTILLGLRNASGKKVAAYYFPLLPKERTLQYYLMARHQTLVVRTDRGVHLLDYKRGRHLKRYYSSIFPGIDKEIGLPKVAICDSLLLIRFQGQRHLLNNSLDPDPLLDELPDFDVHAMFKDREGNFWLCTPNKGVIFVSALSANVRNLYFGEVGQPGRVMSLAMLSDSQVVVGLDDGSLRIWPGNQKPFFPGVKVGVKPANFVIGRMKAGPNNSLWVKTEEYVARAIHTDRDPEYWEWKLFEKLKLNQRYPKVILPDSAGGCWVGTSQGVFHIDLEGNYNEICSYRTRSLAQAEDGALWLGTTKGLFRYHRKKLSSWAERFEELGAPVHFLSLSEVGLWIGVPGRGIFLLSEEELHHLPETQQLRVFDQFNNGTQYLAHSQGIVELKVLRERPFNYAFRDLPIYGTTASREMHRLTGTDTVLYAGTNEGLSIIQPDKLIPPKAPEIHFSHLSSGGQSLNPEESFTLANNQNHLEIHFAGISYQSMGQLTYRYRLNPEEEWVETGKRELILTNLATGPYHFEVEACTPDGIKSRNRAAFSFEILPHWSETMEFRIGIAGVIVLLMWFFYRLRLRAIRHRFETRLHFQQKVNELETQALSAQMNPHFIFNCLNSLQFLIMDQKNSLAFNYIARFGRLIRLNLDLAREKQISLQQELSRLELYTELEKMRLGSDFEFQIILDPAIDPSREKIPNMILQPLVENAIVHGFQRDSDTKNRIEVSIQPLNSGVEIIVSDNGIGLKKSRELSNGNNNSQGLRLIRERLQAASQHEDSHFDLQLSERRGDGGELTGTQVRLWWQA